MCGVCGRVEGRSSVLQSLAPSLSELCVLLEDVAVVGAAGGCVRVRVKPKPKP